MPKSAKSGGGTQTVNDGLEDINPAHREENETYIYYSVAVLLGIYHEVDQNYSFLKWDAPSRWSFRPISAGKA